MNRPDRVKGISKHARGQQTGSSNDNVVTRAYQFDYHEYTNPASGTDRINSDDFCLVLIKAKLVTIGGNATKAVHMVLCKIQRLGHRTGPQLELSQNAALNDFRATVNIVLTEDSVDSKGEPCLRSSGLVHASIKNVDASCITLLCPKLEETISSDGINTTTNAIFPVEDLKNIHRNIFKDGLHHRVRDSISVPYMSVNGEPVFRCEKNTTISEFMFVRYLILL